MEITDQNIQILDFEHVPTFEQFVIKLDNRGYPIDHPHHLNSLKIIHPDLDYFNLPAGWEKFIRRKEPTIPEIGHLYFCDPELSFEEIQSRYTLDMYHIKIPNSHKYVFMYTPKNERYVTDHWDVYKMTDEQKIIRINKEVEYTKQVINELKEFHKKSALEHEDQKVRVSSNRMVKKLNSARIHRDNIIHAKQDLIH